MSDPTFNSVKIRHDTAGTVGDLLTLDMVSGSNGTGAALSFIGHSAVEGLSLALGRLSALRVDAGTVRIDLALIADPTVSSGDDTPPLLSLVTAPAPTGRQVITAPASTLAVGGALNVSGTTTLAKTTVGGTLSVSGTTTMGGTLSVSGATTLAGTLNVDGNVSLGTSSPQRRLHVEGSEIHSGGAGAGFSFSDRGSPFVDSGSNGQRWVWYASGSSARLWSGEDKLTVSPNGSLGLRNSENGFVSLTGTKYDNESSLRPNNLKLVMGTSRFLTFPLGQPLEYEFAIGHVFTRFLITSPGGVSRFTTNFVKVFSVNQDGTAFFAGGKGGYVVDNFVNRVGDTIEQGDVIVISHQQSTLFTGIENNIPLPEVDLTDQAYDRRVCGIVARVLTAADLPHVEPTPEELVAPNDAGTLEEPSSVPYIHPLGTLAPAPSADLDRTKIQDQQLGMMVTLGAFAHCKVDAEIAPIEVGDLLTTSPTRGYAQKVLDPAQATGAIVGKALAGLAQGKGKIPVLVLLQ